MTNNIADPCYECRQKERLNRALMDKCDDLTEQVEVLELKIKVLQERNKAQKELLDKRIK